ncbi:MAG: DUF554 domain-containing protein [Spirulinaceae cyanobacterium]
MALDFWAKTSGTWINACTVLLGTVLGLLLKNRLSSHMQQIITQGIGLLTLWIGFNMADSLQKVQAGEIDGAILGLLALVIGGILGEWWQIEAKLTVIGEWLKVRFRGQGRFTEGFVAASILFCVGPMTLIGSLNNGLTGDNTLLTVKATMDGIVSIAFSSSYGIGVGFSVLVILIYQGGLSLAAGLLGGFLSDPSSDPAILLVTGVGGLMIMAIGLSLLDILKIRVASFLPAIILAPLIFHLVLNIDH